MKRLALLAICCFSIMAWNTATASVVDWSVGDPGTTYQMWDFGTDMNPVAPEIDQNQFGDAVAKISNGMNPDFTWANGVWSGTKFSVTIDIPNQPIANPYKEVLVELVYKGTIVLDWVKTAQWDDFTKIYTEDIDLGNGWTKRVDVWQFEPNPDWERICYGFNPEVTGAPAAIDSIAVSTICVPEPMTLGLLGLGFAALRRKK